MAPHEPTRPIRHRIRTRPHRKSVKIISQVLRQCIRRCVASLRLLGQGPQADQTEIRRDLPRPTRSGRLLRRGRDRLLDDSFALRRGKLAQLVGTLSRQQFVENNTQRIHVRRRRHRLTPELFGGGIRWCQRAGCNSCQSARIVVLQNLCDTEVQQLRQWRPVRRARDHDV